MAALIDACSAVNSCLLLKPADRDVEGIVEMTLDGEMKAFLDWFNAKAGIDPVLKAGLAHLWLVTIHPFDDGAARKAGGVPAMHWLPSIGFDSQNYFLRDDRLYPSGFRSMFYSQ